MTKDPHSTDHGMPWPEDYASLHHQILENWKVSEDIYLSRQLSGGKSGAMVFLADVTSDDFTGQAILKLDRAPDPAWQEKSEADRHSLAIEAAPEYAEKHLPNILHTLHNGESLAILSTIAERGLEYAVPWLACGHDRQLSIARQLCGSLLDDWNHKAKLAPGLQSPQTLLRGWLAYRLDPEQGQLHRFLQEGCGISADEPSLTFEGQWYPNPLAFATSQLETDNHLKLRAVLGNLHGDLHGLNVLVSNRGSGRDHYYLIDLALYQDQQFLFYDHAYFALSFLLAQRGKASAAHWLSVLNNLCPHDENQFKSSLRGDDIGLFEVLNEIRHQVLDWIDRNQANRLSYMTSQFELAQIAVGLNFANKPLADRERRMAFLYAASALRDYLVLHGVDWPKHGPPFAIEGQPTSSPASFHAGEIVKETGDAGHEFPTLPEKPAIAVLAFGNLSGDPDREFFADGVTDEIITDLSRVDWLMVISRGSTFTYKGQTADAKQIGRELGVHYLVEGVVRKDGERVRVTAKLIDTRDGAQLWAERYDRHLEDIFQLQEDIAAAIVASIDSILKVAERERAKKMGGKINTWEAYQKGMWHFHKFTEDQSEIARQHLSKLTSDAPEFAGAYAALALLEMRKLFMGDPEKQDERLTQSLKKASKAVELDEDNSMARIALSRVYAFQGKYDQAIEEAEHAITLNPSSSGGYLNLAAVLFWGEHAERALQAIETSIRLSPRGPLLHVKLMLKGLVFYVLDNYGEAATLMNQADASHVLGPFTRLMLAAIYVRQDRPEEARAAIAEALTLRPGMTVSRFRDAWRTMAPRFRDKLMADMSRAGLPD